MRQYRVLALLFVVLLMPHRGHADNVLTNAQSGIQQVYPNATDKDSYNQRSQKDDAAGDHASALANLKKSCSLEPDKAIADLCMMEAKEYAAKYGLPQ
jgi:hypothetical protein